MTDRKQRPAAGNGKHRRLLWVGLFLLIVAVGLPLADFAAFLSRPVTPPDSQVIAVHPGEPFRRVAAELERQGVVDSALRLRLLARWQGTAGRVQAGRYLFVDPATPAQVLERLVRGDVLLRKITIPEGLTMVEIADRLQAADVVSAADFLAACRNRALLAKLGIDGPSLEGYLFPETYRVGEGISADELASLMVAQFRAQVSPELLGAAKKQGLNLRQLVTLASIIQKEAGNVDEMPLISAVFHNRLKRGIALQADPTVIYGISDFDGNLTRKHLTTDTPYNTYMHPGLPPGPIANPGKAALEAAAHPADVDYLYFVANGKGSHVFARTLAEHNANVRRYQLHRR